MSICEAPKCDGETHANGLCFKHYMRLRRHGSIDPQERDSRGTKSSHPLWEMWKSMLRGARRNGGYDPRWDDFWAFLDDVGERPEANYRLYRKPGNTLYSKATTEWRKPISDVSQLKDRADYMRVLRIKRPELFRASYFKRHYGITVEKYEEMLEFQGAVCAICRQPEKSIHKVTGEPMLLAVDHNHQTHAVRGLLCSLCNRAIGLLGDSPMHLRAAIAYLEKHAVP